MIIDMHTSVVPDDPAEWEHWRTVPGLVAGPEQCTVDSTVARMDAAGVEKSVIWFLGRTLDDSIRFNSFVASVAEKHPDRFIPFAAITPRDDLDGALREVDRAIEDLGMAGVKVHPYVMDVALNDPNLLRLLERVRELDVAFVVHVDPTLARQLPPGPGGAADAEDPVAATTWASTAQSDPAKLARLIETWDSPRFQSAHMGGITDADVSGSHITFQTTGASSAVIRWAIEQIGPRRIVFGSDFPFFRVEDEIAKIQDLPISDGDKTMLLSGNALERVLPSR